MCGGGDVVRCEEGGACGEGRGTFGSAKGRRRGVLCCCVWGARRCAGWGGLGRGRHRVEGEEGRVCMRARYQCNCTQTTRGKEKARARARTLVCTRTPVASPGKMHGSSDARKKIHCRDLDGRQSNRMRKPRQKMMHNPRIELGTSRLLVVRYYH